MIGVKEFINNYQHWEGDTVTFGNGSKSNVLGIGVLNVDDILKINNVLHVRGLTANLISIS